MMMLIDSRSGDAGDESRILSTNKNALVGLGSPSASTAPRRSASNDVASGATYRKRPHIEQEAQLCLDADPAARRITTSAMAARQWRLDFGRGKVAIRRAIAKAAQLSGRACES
jgi:hypothetical protein